MEHRKHYKGKLTIEQIARGIQLALQNARDLSDEAAFLFERERYARAFALASSAMEEVGKVHILKTMAQIPPQNQRLWKEQWANFRRHERKTARGKINLLPDEVRADQTSLASFAANEISQSVDTESARQSSLYVDFARNRWRTPRDVSKKEASTAVEGANQAAERLEHMAELGLLSPKALEIEHDVFSPLNRSRPRERDLTPDHMRLLQVQMPAKMRDYCKRLVNEGVLAPDSDLEIRGIPLRQLLDGDDSEV